MITTLMRLPSPAPGPQALTFDGESLWLSSWETQRLYGIHPQQFTVFEETAAPSKAIGMTAVGDELRVVCSEEDDNRYIRRFIPGHGFKSERIACPDHTGSFLAFDGSNLWLSQRHNMRVLELDPHFEVVTELKTDAQIMGIVWVGSDLYLSTWHGKDGGCKIGRMTRETAIEYVDALPFAGISLVHDGSRFWTNDHRGNAVVAFTLND